MPVVDYFAELVRDQMTTYADYLAISTSTTQAITVETTTINGIITTVSRVSISYPSNKEFTNEYVLDSGASNDNVLRRIAVLSSVSTSQIVSGSNTPSLDKNNLVEVVYEVTFKVVNE